MGWLHTNRPVAAGLGSHVIEVQAAGAGFASPPRHRHCDAAGRIAQICAVEGSLEPPQNDG